MNPFPFIGLPPFSFKGNIFTLLIFFFKSRINLLFRNFIFFFGYHSLINQLLFVNLTNWSHFGNLFVHQGLSEGWLIEFIVTVFSISNKINHDIMVEFLTIFSSNGENVMYILKTLSIDMEDRSIYGFCKIGSMVSRPSFAWNCCKTDLVINNDVNSSTDCVIL